MVHILKPLEDITAKAGSDVIFDTIMELKDPNIRMQWFLVQLVYRLVLCPIFLIYECFFILLCECVFVVFVSSPLTSSLYSPFRAQSCCGSSTLMGNTE